MASKKKPAKPAKPASIALDTAAFIRGRTMEAVIVDLLADPSLDRDAILGALVARKVARRERKAAAA
jgi:hypothetical protein